MDLFGFERETRIKESNVRNIFTPHQPIQSFELFLGRQQEVQSLVEHLNTPGQHALLFGDRGVGKSSLANVASSLLLKFFDGGGLTVKRCDSSDNFITIVGKILESCGIDVNVLTEQGLREDVERTDIGPKFLRFGKDNRFTNIVNTAGFGDRANSPSWVASKIKNIKGLFLVDEVDALISDEDKRKLAELVKQLSDEGSSLKILLVGIAATATELTAGHPSIQRCLKETKLKRMEDYELRQIIESGQRRIGLSFSENAIEKIVSVSSGYPHFTHLLALKSAEDAIAEDRKNISVTDVIHATNRAVGDAEGSLKKVYDDAIRSANTEQYSRILVAAAASASEDITAKNLRSMYQRLWGQEISQNTLNNYFQRLVDDEGKCILRRLAKGVYRFSDPRMASYIRIANLEALEASK